MTFFKGVFSKYIAAPAFFCKRSYSQSIKLMTIAILLGAFTSCNPVALVNPDSYGDKWENTYLWFEPGDMSTIYISDNGDPSTAEAIPNDTEFLIQWSEKGEVYELNITSYYQDIDFAWFDGYDADNSSEEIPWIHDENSIRLRSSKLLPSENGKYRISISEDLKD